MKLLIPKLLIAIAGSFLLGHNLSPHLDNSIEITQHHHNDDDQEHSIFSFGQLDGNFIPAKSPSIVNPDFISQLFFLPNITLLTNLSFTERNTEYGTYQEFPPPENYNCSASLRAPPALIG
ncbi:MAG: hypothetical protein HY841_07210 [Bacteroidetes bacterium]|nr:hypothetical protein [Bacteroidota bacterium]